MNKKIGTEELYSRIKSEMNVGVRHGRFFVRTENNWSAILANDLAICIRSLYREDDQKLISASAIKEVQERLLQDPYAQLSFLDEGTEKYVKLKHSVFNVEKGSVESLEGDFSYFYNFDYIRKEERKMPIFEKYIDSVFPNENKVKRKLLLQILGYCLSDYTKAKAAFFFIGVSNSGKSTIFELLKKVVPAQFVTAIPLYRLDNRFNLARLSEARINLCSEISEKSFIAADIFKMLTSNEMVTAEHKGAKPFEFRVQCKLLNAGNILPEIRQEDGAEAMLNRMILLLFPVSITKDKQDISLVEKLYNERNSIFSAALDELVELKNNQFGFIEPEDSARIKRQILEQSQALDAFIYDSCVRDKDAKVYLKDIYEAFKEYCEENLLALNYSKIQFSQSIARYPYITQKKMRIGRGGKPLSGLVGIRLKDEKEYHAQDSERYSGNMTSDITNRNTGTLEQEA